MDKNIFLLTLLIFFLVFITMYFGIGDHYYEYAEGKKVRLVQDKIAEFEERVRNGEDIDMDDFFLEQDKEYSNKVSNLGMKTSKSIEKYTKGAMKSIFSVLEKLFED